MGALKELKKQNKKEHRAEKETLKQLYKLESFEEKHSNTVMQDTLSIPYKSPACKKCPALASGLCKCAVKKLKH